MTKTFFNVNLLAEPTSVRRPFACILLVGECRLATTYSTIDPLCGYAGAKAASSVFADFHSAGLELQRKRTLLVSVVLVKLRNRPFDSRNAAQFAGIRPRSGSCSV